MFYGNPDGSCGDWRRWFHQQKSLCPHGSHNLISLLKCQFVFILTWFCLSKNPVSCINSTILFYFSSVPLHFQGIYDSFIISRTHVESCGGTCCHAHLSQGVGRNQEATKHGPRRIEWRRGTLKTQQSCFKSLSSTWDPCAVGLLCAVTENWWQSWNRLIISHVRKGMDLRGTSTMRSLKSFQGAHREMDQLVINHVIHSCSIMLVATYRILNNVWIQNAGLFRLFMYVFLLQYAQMCFILYLICIQAYRNVDQIVHDV